MSHWIETDRALIIEWLNLHRKKFYKIDHFTILIDFSFFLTLSTLDLLSTSRSHKNLFVINLLTLFESCTFSKPRKIMVTLIQWSSSQKAWVNFHEIDPPRFLSSKTRFYKKSLAQTQLKVVSMFQAKATNVFVQQHSVDRSLRGKVLGQKFRGCTIWFTGL